MYNDVVERNRSEAELFCRLVVLLGGSIAGRRLKSGPFTFESMKYDGSGSDWEKFDSVVAAFCTKRTRESFSKWIHARAEELLSDHWNRVQAVAAALQGKKTLTSSEVDSICQNQ